MVKDRREESEESLKSDQKARLCSAANGNRSTATSNVNANSSATTVNDTTERSAHDRARQKNHGTGSAPYIGRYGVFRNLCYSTASISTFYRDLQSTHCAWHGMNTFCIYE